MEASKVAELEITVEEGDLDEDQFASVWNIASSTMKGDQEQTRLLASKLIGFPLQTTLQVHARHPNRCKVPGRTIRKRHRVALQLEA